MKINFTIKNHLIVEGEFNQKEFTVCLKAKLPDNCSFELIYEISSRFYPFSIQENNLIKNYFMSMKTEKEMIEDFQDTLDAIYTECKKV